MFNGYPFDITIDVFFGPVDEGVPTEYRGRRVPVHCTEEGVFVGENGERQQVFGYAAWAAEQALRTAEERQGKLRVFGDFFSPELCPDIDYALAGTED